jgi:integrase/recombinase XerD
VDPLPEYLTDEQAASVLEAAKSVAHGEKLEMRPLLAITLVLETGIKKGECLQLLTEDLDRDSSAPGFTVRYPKRHLQYKDRRLAISKDALKVVEQYLQRYEPSGRLFDCTGRNLEYIFNRRIAPLAGLACLTFEQMRWTCAVRDWRMRDDTGVSDGQLQVKYGLSAAAWAEMAAKLQRLMR